MTNEAATSTFTAQAPGILPSEQRPIAPRLSRLGVQRAELRLLDLEY